MATTIGYKDLTWTPVHGGASPTLVVGGSTVTSDVVDLGTNVPHRIGFTFHFNDATPTTTDGPGAEIFLIFQTSDSTGANVDSVEEEEYPIFDFSESPRTASQWFFGPTNIRAVPVLSRYLRLKIKPYSVSMGNFGFNYTKFLTQAF